MKTPLFISASAQCLPTWETAFPNLSHCSGLPEKFDIFDSSIIFLDFMNLTDSNKFTWLKACVESERKVFVLSPTPNESEAIEVIKNGAVGYGHTLASETRLREMAMVVQHGGLWLGDTLIRRVMAALSVQNKAPLEAESPIDRFANQLTEREFTVAGYVAKGASNTDIALALDISERTVKAHISASFLKLKVKNRVELALLLNNVQSSPLSMVK